MNKLERGTLSSLARLGVPVGAGIVAGVLSSFVASGRESPPAGPEQRLRVVEAHAAEAPRAARGGAAPAATARDLSGITRRLEAVEEKISELPAQEAAAEPPSEAEVAAMKRAYEEEIEGRLAKHEAAPADPSWSGEAAASIADAAGILAEHGPHPAELAGVECRANSCVAKLDFPSFGAARAGHATYVTNALGMRCAQTADLSDPEDPSAPYTVRVLFYDCLRE